MKAYKVVIAIFAMVVVVAGFAIMSMELGFFTEEHEVTRQQQRVIDCYNAALECREDNRKCGACFAACTYFSSEEEVKENAIQNCRLGEAEAILR